VISSGSSGGGDNWGGQAVIGDVTLTGNGTSVSPLSVAQQAASGGQVLKWDGTNWAPFDTPWYELTTGSANAYSLSLNPGLANYYTGLVVHFKANFSNTGAVTLNIDGLGAVPLKRNYDQDLSSGDIKNGQLVIVMYDGTNFQMLSQIGNAPAAASPANYGFTQASNGMWYKFITCHGYLTIDGGVGLRSFAWRLANQSETNALASVGLLPSGQQGWSGDGYPGQEAGYQYYWNSNGGSVTWHQSDWGNANYKRAILIWTL